MASLRNDAWFAGFTDGEGCFVIGVRSWAVKGGRTRRLVPMFEIALRADDLEILDALRAEFGGTMCVHAPQGASRPCARWQVSRKDDLGKLVEYFDRFPLRAKKARDYAIWRRAAFAYCARGSYAPELWPLREALTAGRKYDADLREIEESPQFKLVASDAP